MGTPTAAPAAPAPFRAVLRNRSLRRLHYALIGSITGRFAYAVALGVYCFQEGGAALVGLAGALRVAPSAVVAPFATVLVDRYRREDVMVASDLGRAVLMTLTALAIVVGGGPVAVLALVTVSGLLAPLFEPARAALLPALVDEPEQLTAANVVGSAVNSVGYFVAPALGGVLLVLTSPAAVFAMTSAALVWSAACIRSLDTRHDARPEATEGAPTGMLGELVEGWRAVTQDRGVAALLGLFALQVFVGGAVMVLVVVLALDTLEAGVAWVGYFEASLGVGAIVGTVVVLRVVSRLRLSTGVSLGFALWGLPLLLAAFVDSRLGVLAALLLIGVGDTAVDVCGITLLQRVVPEGLLGRVLGLLETGIVVGQAAGALLTPLLIVLIGVKGTLVLLALMLPAVALVCTPALRGLDARADVPEAPRALLRGNPIFRPLPLPTLDALALALKPVSVPAGAAVFTQGDPGDRFFLIESGAAEVVCDGEVVRTLGPGDGFGEIALLRDLPRTATVIATAPLSLLALDRAVFLGAVTGHDRSRAAAEGVATARIDHARPAVAR